MCGCALLTAYARSGCGYGCDAAKLCVSRSSGAVLCGMGMAMACLTLPNAPALVGRTTGTKRPFVSCESHAQATKLPLPPARPFVFLQYFEFLMTEAAMFRERMPESAEGQQQEQEQEGSGSGAEAKKVERLFDMCKSTVEALVEAWRKLLCANTANRKKKKMARSRVLASR